MNTRASGTVAFLLTDIEGSSRLWEIHPDGMRDALATHDRLLRQAIASNKGRVFGTAGDAIAAAFSKVEDAVTAAITAQTVLSNLVADSEVVRVRMAIHCGAAEERDGDYFGQVLNRCGRLRDAAHGGQVLVSQSARGLLGDLGPSGIGLIDLGEYRLRDLERPEWIFQVTHPGLNASFPPLRIMKATTNLPVQLTSFVGREQELEEVAKLIRGSRLTTLTGFGGSGKTRLAMQVAASMEAEFADGVWFIDLARISERELVVQQISSVLGVSERADHSLIQGLVDHLRPRNCLLILDNCEHLIDEISYVTSLLLGDSNCLRILATSREALRLPGEVTYLIPPLGLPQPGQSMDPQQISRFDAVRLFVSRAEAVRPGFRLNAEMSAHVIEICRRLDGIPLAIELAAACLSSFTPQQIANNLDRRFRLLGSNRRVGVARQETLRATIDWSYELLKDAERTLFLRLAVFRSDFSLEAAQRILADEMLDEMDLLELLPRLIDKSLVVSEPGGDEMRYRLLETLRQYALEKGSPGESDLFEERQVAYFLDLAEAETANLRSTKHEQALERLQLEHDNMRQALRWGLDKNEIAMGLRLAGALYRFWLYNDNHSEGAWWLEAYLTRLGAVDNAVRAKALLGYGSLVGQQFDKAQSGTAALKQAIEIYRGLTDQTTTNLDYATALNNLGADLVTTGNFAEAAACYEEALGISKALNMQWGVALIHTNLGRLAAWSGRIDEGRHHFEQGVDQSRLVGSLRLMADALAGKANFERDFGNPVDAIDAYKKSVGFYTEAGLTGEAQWISADLAIAYLRLNDRQLALEVFLPNAAALVEDAEMGNQAGVLVDLALGRAEIDFAFDEDDTAATLLGFVEGLVASGGYEDFRPRLQLIKSVADGKTLALTLGNGPTIAIDQVRDLITRPTTGPAGIY